MRTSLGQLWSCLHIVDGGRGSAYSYFLRNQAHRIAGWSSLVARRAHNPKVVGSNPAPATINCLVGTHEGPDFFVMCGRLWPSPLLGFCCLPKIGRQFLKDVLVEAVLYQESLPAPRAAMLS